MAFASVACLSLFAQLLSSTPGAAQPTQSPNIVLILTDDQGYGDFGFTGNPIVRTPRIDAMAAQSAWMTNFYVSPVCSPTRASLMTGRYNYRTRVVDTFKGRSMMDGQEVTAAEVLKTVGYATGIFGKWHLGDNHPLRPIDQGFDVAWVHRGGGLAQPSEPIENANRYTDPILMHNGIAKATEGYCTDVYFDKALNFIERCARAEKPFFAYLPTNAPHGPFHDVPQDKLAYYQQQDMSAVGVNDKETADVTAKVFAMIENIDDNVGRLLDRLDQLKIADNTLVIYMVDNGPAPARTVGPFRGSKCQVLDGGIRSPFIARLPSRFAAGTKCDAIAAHIDVMPTLADLAGASLDESVKLDGRSLVPMLSGKMKHWSDDRMLVIQSHRGDEPIRRHNFGLRTERWKLVHLTGFGREQMPDKTPYALFEIGSDPDESDDVASQNPKVVEELLERYDAWFTDVSQTRVDNYDPPRMNVGRASLPPTVLTSQDWRVAKDAPGWGLAGTWMLHNEATQPLRMRIQFARPIDAEAMIQIAIGDRDPHSIKPEIAPESTKQQPVHVSSITLPKGPVDLRIWAETNGKIQPVYDVTLSVAE